MNNNTDKTLTDEPNFVYYGKEYGDRYPSLMGIDRESADYVNIEAYEQLESQLTQANEQLEQANAKLENIRKKYAEYNRLLLNSE